MIMIDSVLGYTLKAHGIWQGVATIVICCLAITVSIFFTIVTGLGVKFKERDNDSDLRAAVEEDTFFKCIYENLYIILIVIASIYLISAILQVVGILQDRPKFIIPALICDIFFQLMAIPGTIATAIYVTISKAYLHVFWLQVGVLIGLFEAPAFLSWMGTYCLYKNMTKSQRTNIESPD